MIVKELEKALEIFKITYENIYNDDKLSLQEKFIKKMEMTVEFAKLAKDKTNSFNSFIDYVNKSYDIIEIIHHGKILSFAEAIAKFKK